MHGCQQDPHTSSRLDRALMVRLPSSLVFDRYDTAADIWSFGITLLELAQGHAPMARLAPLKVLVNTIKFPPPELPPDSSGKHFSKALGDRELVSEQGPQQTPHGLQAA